MKKSLHIFLALLASYATAGIFSGINTAASIYVGTNAATAVWSGTNLVWSGTFAPTDLSDCVVWLDASDTSTITTSTSNSVSLWADKSGAGNDARKSGTVAVPTTGVDTQNSLNVLTFHSQGLICVYKPDSHDTTFIVFRRGTGYQYSFGVLENTRNRRYYFSATDNLLTDFCFGTSAKRTSTVPINEHDYNVLMYAHSQANRAGYCRINGAATQTFPYGASDNSPDGNTSFGIGLFGYGTELSNQHPELDGNVAEVIIYNRLLSDSECGTVEAYLTDKWGL